MNNKQISQHVRSFRDAREGWIDALTKSDSVQAAQHVLSINSKIELLMTMWNWSDESVDFPFPN